METYGSIVDFIYETYIRPAAQRGAKSIKIPALEVFHGLKGSYTLLDIHDTLGSRGFRNSFLLTPMNTESSGSYLPTVYSFGFIDRKAFNGRFPPPASPPQSPDAA